MPLQSPQYNLCVVFQYNQCYCIQILILVIDFHTCSISLLRYRCQISRCFTCVGSSTNKSCQKVQFTPEIKVKIDIFHTFVSEILRIPQFPFVLPKTIPLSTIRVTLNLSRCKFYLLPAGNVPETFSLSFLFLLKTFIHANKRIYP